MAERRMFAKTIIDSDAFLELPITAQLLYFHLAMRADDDGFCNKPRAIMNMCGAKNDDIRVLRDNKFIIIFENGVIVIKHWRIHNYIRKDTYAETKYKFEKSTLYLDENNAYSTNEQAVLLPVNEPSTECQRTVNEPSTQDRIGKDSIGKVSIDKDRIDCLTNDIYPTFEEVSDYMTAAGSQSASIDKFFKVYSDKSWYFGKKPWKQLADEWIAKDNLLKTKSQIQTAATEFKPQSEEELLKLLDRI